jgi:hypothetical protein
MYSRALVANIWNPTYQEAEIRRIAVQSQPGGRVQETLSQKKPITKKGLLEWLKV